MRVAVSGAHGVGKTTFCNDFADALRNKGLSVDVKTDVARTLREEGVAINQQTEGAEYALFLEKHLDNLYAEPESDVVMYDRTMLDTIAYATANGNLDDRWLSFLRKAAAQLIRPVDLYLYISIEFGLEDDGIRATGQEYQTKVDQALMEILKECRSDILTLSGTRSERVEQALQYLKR